MKIYAFLAILLLTQCVQVPPPLAPTESPQLAPLYPASSEVVQEQQASNALWQRTSLRTAALANGAELHEFTARSATESADVTVVIFDSQNCALKVLDQPTQHAGGRVLSSLMRNAGAIAGVNGGFFHPDFSTLGLMISNGQKTGSFLKTSLVSGSLVVIGQEPYLVWNAEFMGENRVTQMVQAGPRLVDDGQPLSSLNRTRKAARSFIATDGGRRWALGTVRSTTLAGLGDLLASSQILPNFRVQRALNFDGGHSTAFYARKSDGAEISDPGWSTVRNYVAVVPR